MNSKLNKFSKNYTSQHGEDGILEYIISKIPNIPQICVEFGAWDGKFLSNTYTLWHDKNWQGILIEGDKEKCEMLKKEYLGKYEITVYNQLVTPRGKTSIDALFKNQNLIPQIGVMSIDIDSDDYYVWKYLEYVKPYIVIIEHNYSIPGYIEYVDPEDEVFMRCSAKSLEKLGDEKSYKLICCTLSNSIFIKQSLFNDLDFPDKPVEYLFNYSQCQTPILTASQVPVNNLIPVYYGLPQRSVRISLLIERFFKSIVSKNKSLKKPGSKLIDHCRKYGIYIETFRKSFK
jgi:hypothetical protein